MNFEGIFLVECSRYLGVEGGTRDLTISRQAKQRDALEKERQVEPKEVNES